MTNQEEFIPSTKKLKVAIYARVSSEEQAEMFGLTMQLDSIKSYINARNETLELAGEEFIYQDDISGVTKIEERPQLAKLFEDLERLPEKPFDIVVVYKIDRFARDLYLLLQLIRRLESEGVGFASVHENVDTSTAFGKAMLGILGVFAQFERDTIRQRTKDGRASAAKKGVFIGTAPYGFTKDGERKLIPLQEEAEIVRLIFKMYAIERRGKEEIARYLNKKGVICPELSAIRNKKKDEKKVKTMPKRSKWYAATIKNMLVNELYIGNYYYDTVSRKKDDKTGKLIETRYPKDKWKLSDYHPPVLVDIATFEEAQRRKENDSSVYRGTPKNNYLLSGLIRCDSCWSEETGTRRELWVGQPKKKGDKTYLYYRCDNRNNIKAIRKCTCIPIPALELDNFVRDRIKEMLANPEFFIQYKTRLNSSKFEIDRQRKIVETSKAFLDSVKQRRSNMRYSFESGRVSQEQYDKDWNDLNKRVGEHKQKIKEGTDFIAQNERLLLFSEGIQEYKRRYSDVIEKLLGDYDSAKVIVNSLVEEITIYSRPITKGDGVSGPKKLDQEIVSYIDITMKLPMEIIRDLAIYPETKSFLSERSSSSESSTQAGNGSRTRDLSLTKGVL